MPVDFTLLTAILLIAALFFNIYNKGIRLKINKIYLYSSTLILFFYLWMIISLIYTPSTNYAYVKTFYFLTNILAFIYPIIIKDFNYKTFIKYFIITVLIFSIFFLKNYSKILSLYRSGGTQIIGLYLVLGTLLGIALMLLITTQKSIFSQKYIDYSLAILSVILLFLMGARGPLIFSFGLLVLYFILRILKNVRKKINIKILLTVAISSIIALFLAVIFYFYNRQKIEPFIERSTSRIEIMMNSSVNNSVNGSVKVRVDQLNFTLNKIFENPESFFIGHGIGSFNLLYKGEDGRGYPHNIFLEVWFELGLIGELLFLSFFILILFRKPTNYYISIWLILYILLNMAKSNSLIDIRTYFAFFAMYLISTKNIKKYNT